MNRAGLCVVDPEQKTVIVLKRSSPYKTSHQSSNKLHFVEQYAIPRGKKLKKNESLLRCATREFIEETMCFFVNINISATYFRLYFEDPPGSKWEYAIFFAFASITAENLIHIPNKDKKSIKYEPWEINILTIEEYLKIMQEQLKIYGGENNYKIFLTALQKINESSLIQLELLL